MNLTELTSLASAVSAIAVLLSLLLVRSQIHQSQKNQRALIQQGRAGRSAEIALRMMSSDFATAYHRCMDGDTDVTEIQMVQFIGYCRAVFLGAEDSFLQHHEGLLDELAFKSFIKSLRVLLMSPGMRAAWCIVREWYEAEFVAFMDGVIGEATTYPVRTQLAEWKKVVQAVVGLKSAA
jgi:hypothetical protein